MKVETAPELDLDEAILLRSKYDSPNKKQKSSHCKHKRVQSHNKHTIEVCMNFLEINESLHGSICSFKQIKTDIYLVKQPKIAVNTFDDERCYTDKHNSIAWGYNPSSKLT